MTSKNEKYEVPVILYEEPKEGCKPSPIPYIEVTREGKMPPVLFIFEYKHSGEQEPGPDGQPLEIVDQIPHKYCDLEFLKEKLPPHLNDMVRMCLGMKPLKEAQVEGQKVIDKVQQNAEKFREQKLASRQTQKD